LHALAPGRAARRKVGQRSGSVKQEEEEEEEELFEISTY